MTVVVPVEKLNIKAIRNGEEVKEDNRCLVKYYQKIMKLSCFSR